MAERGPCYVRYVGRVRWFLLGALFAGVVCFPIAFFALTRPSLRVVHTWKKDPAALYDGQPVYLTVFESDTNWRGFPLSVRPSHAIYVGRDAGTPSYGHEMPFEFHGAFGDPDATIKASVVTWSDDGVLFVSPSSHRLFIPTAMFLGGR